ncbi:hypothetical protein Q3C01_01085 [Bradyrhizobium sp. UFLA05-109]
MSVRLKPEVAAFHEAEAAKERRPVSQYMANVLEDAMVAKRAEAQQSGHAA